MTAEQIVILVTSLVASSAVVLGPILLYLVRMKNENSLDHAKVTSSVDVLAAQVATLTGLVVESVSELKAHTKWEETQKYASPEHIERLIQAIKDQPSVPVPEQGQ